MLRKWRVGDGGSYDVFGNTLGNTISGRLKSLNHTLAIRV